MGRIKQTIKVDGLECWTLFDTGMRNTYVSVSIAKVLTTTSVVRPVRTRLSDEVKETHTSAILNAEVDGHAISTHAFVVDHIETDAEGRPVEIFFGALAMKQWGILPIPDENRLDLTHYPEVFVEY
jgi:hypothetical protein